MMLHCTSALTMGDRRRPRPAFAASWSQALLAAGTMTIFATSCLAQRADFNGDGFADLAIGAPSIGREGRVRVIYGSSTGLTGTAGPGDQSWRQGHSGLGGIPEPGDNFGAALATGDFNNDGYGDLVVGTPGEDDNSGELRVLYGSARGLQVVGVGAPPEKWIRRGLPGVEGTRRLDDRFGDVLAAGDFNNDGYDDIAVGAPGFFSANPDRYAEGSVSVFYGSVTGIQFNGQGGPDDQFWKQGLNGLQGVSQRHDHFGNALTVADFNRDGFADLAIGIVSNPGGGALSVLYGSAAGLQATGSGAPDDQFIGRDSPGVKGHGGEGGFGAALTAGDFNGDGFADLAVGAPFPFERTGSLNVLYGSLSGLQATGSGGPDDQLWSPDSADVAGTGTPGEKFGASLTAGDFNREGFADLAIGAPYKSRSGLLWYGQVYVLYGSGAGIQAGTNGPEDQLWDRGSIDLQGPVPASYDFFGFALAAGDFNNDGCADLVIGNGAIGVQANGVHVLYGSPGNGRQNGVQATGNGAPDDQFFTPINAGEGFGRALAASN